MRLKKCGSAVTVLAVLALSPQLALAHAVLTASTPRAGETVPVGSLSVDLKFNSRVDGPHSTLSLAGPAGEKPLPLATQVEPNELRTDAGRLAPGNYTLRWQALSSDGHMTRGQIPFTVK